MLSLQLVLSIIYNFFLANGMICVGKETYHGVSIVAQEKGEVKENKEALNKARSLGKKITLLAKRLKRLRLII